MQPLASACHQPPPPALATLGGGPSRSCCAAGRCELFDTGPAREEEPLGRLPAVLQQRDEDGVPAWVPHWRRPVYKTVMCMYELAGECQHGERCLFAHGAGELRVAHVDGSVAQDQDSDEE